MKTKKYILFSIAIAVGAYGLRWYMTNGPTDSDSEFVLHSGNVFGTVHGIETTVRSVSALESLQIVTFQSVTGADITDLLRKSRGSDRLLELHAFNCHFDDATSSLLLKFPNLENVSLVGCNLSGRRWPRLPAIRELDLADTPIDDIGLRDVWKSCPSLEHFQVKGSLVTGTGLRSAIEAMPSQLTTLVIDDADIDHETGERIADELQKASPNLDYFLCGKLSPGWWIERTKGSRTSKIGVPRVGK